MKHLFSIGTSNRYRTSLKSGYYWGMIGFNFNLGDSMMTGFMYLLICNAAGIFFWWAFERHYPTLKRVWLNRSFAGGV